MELKCQYVLYITENFTPERKAQCVLYFPTAHTLFYSACPRLQLSSETLTYPMGYVSNVSYIRLYKWEAFLFSLTF